MASLVDLVRQLDRTVAEADEAVMVLKEAVGELGRVKQPFEQLEDFLVIVERNAKAAEGYANAMREVMAAARRVEAAKAGGA